MTKKSLDVLQKLPEKFVIFKFGKRQGIVLVNHVYYINSLQSIFNNPCKFKKIDEDPVQNSLYIVLERGEITESENKTMQPNSGQIARAHGPPKDISILSNYRNLEQLLKPRNFYQIFSTH